MPRENEAAYNKQTKSWSTNLAGKRHKLVPRDKRRKNPTNHHQDGCRAHQPPVG